MAKNSGSHFSLGYLVSVLIFALMLSSLVCVKHAEQSKTIQGDSPDMHENVPTWVDSSVLCSRPKMIHRIGIYCALEESYHINFIAERALIDSLNLSQFGEVSKGNDDWYSLRVDPRFEFQHIVSYLKQF